MFNYAWAGGIKDINPKIKVKILHLYPQFGWFAS